MYFINMFNILNILIYEFEKSVKTPFLFMKHCKPYIYK